MQSSNPIQVRFYGESGPPYVVLLHGGPGAPGDIAPVARHLKNDFLILEPLQCLSSDDIPLTVDRHVADLYEVLRDFLHDGPVILVGHSWGAMLALTYAARYPVEVDRVILIGCGTFDKHSREAYQTCIAQRANSNTRRINSIEKQLAVEQDRQRRNELFAEFGAIYARIQSFDPLGIQSEALVYDERGYRETWKDALSLQDLGVQPAEFSQIQAAVTMIHGADDPHPGSIIYKTLAPIIHDIQYRELSQCGHIPWIERKARDKFYSLLNESLKNTSQ